MRARILLFLCAASVVAVAQPAAIADQIRAVENGLSTPIVLKDRPAQTHTILERMKSLNIVGVSVAVIHNYEIHWAKGYGVLDKAGKQPVTAQTLFQAGSISKPVAAAAALKLVEDGKLSLDEDVNAKLKSWKVPENEFTTDQKVTLRRLVSHTAGLTVHGFPGYEAGSPVPSVPDVLDGRKPANTPAVRVNVVPGSMWRYSGGGYTIMQLLLTDVTGKSFPDLVRETVLSKASMSRSTYEQPLPEPLRPNTASGYNSKGDPVPGKYHTYPEMAAAGLWTTASDLGRFCIEIQKSREGRSNRILKKETVIQMLTEQKGNYGLGFALMGTESARRFGHNGADEGFQALLDCSFDGEGIAVMVNSDNGVRLAREIMFSAAKAYNWHNIKPTEREVAKVDAKTLESYSGQYNAPQIGLLTIRPDGDHLLVSTPIQADIPLYPSADGSFFPLSDESPAFRFVKNDQGEVTGLRRGGLVAPKVK